MPPPPLPCEPHARAPAHVTEKIPSMKRLQLLSVAALLALPGVTLAQGAPQSPCQAPDYRHFDFWLGEWDVADSTGKTIARSSVTSILAGCAVRESYALLNGPYKGESYNIWDARTKRWHQSWVDNGGLLALFDGGLRGNAMVLERVPTRRVPFAVA
jgi:hypothetical protein